MQVPPTPRTSPKGRPPSGSQEVRKEVGVVPCTAHSDILPPATPLTICTLLSSITHCTNCPSRCDSIHNISLILAPHRICVGTDRGDDELKPFSRTLIEELVRKAMEVATATLGDKKKWREVCPGLPLFAELVADGQLTADSCRQGTKGYTALSDVAQDMGLTDSSDEDDMKAALLTAALRSFAENVPLCNLGIQEICRALVGTRAFLDQKVFKEADVVVPNAKVRKWIERVMGLTGRVVKKFKVDEKTREVVRVKLGNAHKKML